MKPSRWRNLHLEFYHWVTEGFKMKDLQEAKALLAELALVKI